MRRIRTPRRLAQPRRALLLFSLLGCVASLAVAGTISVEVDLDSVAAEFPTADVAQSAGPYPLTRILVPIPRLCRVVSSDVAFWRSETEWPDRDVPVFCGEAVEAGKALAVLHVRRGSARRVDIRIGYEPLPAGERPRRGSLLLATGHGSVNGVALRPPQGDGWYPNQETTLAQLFGGRPPGDFHFRELSRLPLKCDVVTVVCMGGWGTVSLDSADDVRPTVFAIRDSLRAWGLSSLVVPYRQGVGGSASDRLAHVTELLGFHHIRSRGLAREITDLLQNNPGTRIVLVGLSNGATFAGQTMALLDSELQLRVSAIQLGPPAWEDDLNPPNTLVLDNEGRDPLAVGQFDIQLAGLFSKLGRNLWRGLTGQPTRFREATHTPGHDYAWQNVSHRVVPFLRSQLGLESR